MKIVISISIQLIEKFNHERPCVFMRMKCLCEYDFKATNTIQTNERRIQIDANVTERLVFEQKPTVGKHICHILKWPDLENIK